MWEITSSRNLNGPFQRLTLRVPTGIDVRKVVASGLPPTINTGIAHREPGIGQVGAGVVNAPMSCFEQASSPSPSHGGGLMSVQTVNAVRSGFYLDRWRSCGCRLSFEAWRASMKQSS